MEIKKIKTYKFEELTEDAKQTAIADFRESEGGALDGMEFFEDVVREELGERGITVKDLRYSLGHSQGDGLSFTGSVNLPLFLKVHKLPKKYNRLERLGVVFYLVEMQWRPYFIHEGTITVIYEEEGETLTPKQRAEAEELAQDIEEIRRGLCRKYEKRGYEEIDSINSDESISDVLISNEYRFTSEGKRRVLL